MNTDPDESDEGEDGEDLIELGLVTERVVEELFANKVKCAIEEEASQAGSTLALSVMYAQEEKEKQDQLHKSLKERLSAHQSMDTITGGHAHDDEEDLESEGSLRLKKYLAKALEESPLEWRPGGVQEDAQVESHTSVTGGAPRVTRNFRLDAVSAANPMSLEI